MTRARAPEARALWIGLAVAVAAALVAGGSLLRPGFYDSHDGLLNVHRLVELGKCNADGQFPCRWVPDMGRGYGYPLFNFYPPLSTWVAAGIAALGASPLDAVKGSFLLALLAAAAAMFRLAAHFFGPAGGAVAACLYVLAPYQAIDVFVRSALAEVWGMALLPWVFLAGYRCVAAPGRAGAAGLGCALAGAALLLSHDLTAMMAAPAYAAWLIVAWRHSDRSRGTALRTLGAHALAVALAGFFVLPLVFELRHVHADTLVSLYPWARYENNFVPATQLLLSPRPWGYGALGTPNAMSVQLGWLQALLGLGAVAALLVAPWTSAAPAASSPAAGARSRALEVPGRVALVLGVAGIAALLLVLPASRPVWDALPPLAFLQFPWRFLAIACFGLAFAAGWIAYAFGGRPRFAWGLAAGVLALATVGGWREFRPSAMHAVRPEVLANEREVAKARHGLYDFLPRGVDLDAFVASPPPILPAPVQSFANVRVTNAERTSDRVSFQAEVRSDDAVVQLGVFWFPGWTLEVDGEPADFAPADDPFGRLHVRLPRGEHRVVARFENTPVRSLGNALSLVALLAAAGWTALAVRPR